MTRAELLRGCQCEPRHGCHGQNYGLEQHPRYEVGIASITPTDVSDLRLEVYT